MRSTIASSRIRRGLAALTLASLGAAGPGVAAAQPSPGAQAAPPGQPSAADRTLAEALFREGKRLLAEDKVAEACRKFEASYQIDRTGGTVLNLALCHEREGRIASAWAELQEALALAKAAKRRDREKIASEHLAAMEKRLSHLTIRVPEAAQVEGLAVTLDGAAIRKEGWGIPIPVDPGPRKAAATAPGRLPWEQEITVEEAKSTTVEVPALKEVPKPKPPPPPPQPPSRPGWIRPAGYAALGLGVVGLGIGTYFGVRAFSLGSEAQSNCPADACNQAGWDAVNDGRSAATAANIGLGAGVVLAGVGVALVILGGQEPEPAPAAQPAKEARPRVAPSLRLGKTGAALGLEGTW